MVSCTEGTHLSAGKPTWPLRCRVTSHRSLKARLRRYPHILTGARFGDARRNAAKFGKPLTKAADSARIGQRKNATTSRSSSSCCPCLSNSWSRCFDCQQLSTHPLATSLTRGLLLSRLAAARTRECRERLGCSETASKPCFSEVRRSRQSTTPCMLGGLRSRQQPRHRHAACPGPRCS